MTDKQYLMLQVPQLLWILIVNDKMQVTSCSQVTSVKRSMSYCLVLQLNVEFIVFLSMSSVDNAPGKADYNCNFSINK